MSKKSLIIYSSNTGNTEKVAQRFKETFEKKEWDCDMFKVSKKTDVRNPPFNIPDYDFLCVGSPVIIGLPTFEIMDVLTKNPTSPHFPQPTIEEFLGLMKKNDGKMPSPPKRKIRDGADPVGKIVPGPKKGIVFVTYGGIHLGPKEAAAAVAFLENEIEHLRFECVGKFLCPGKHGKGPTPDWWHGDISNRPSERDLKKAEIFLEEILEAP